MESIGLEKIVEIDSHIGCALSGLIADSRTMIDRARVEAQASQYKSSFFFFFHISLSLRITGLLTMNRCLLKVWLKP